MQRPPHGLCLPVILRKVVDGDTIDVSLTWSGVIWRIRLLECWCVDKTDADRQAKAEIERLWQAALPKTRTVAPRAEPYAYLDPVASVYVPIGQGELRVTELLTLSRPLGHVFIGELDVSEHLVALGLATRTKPKARDSRSVSARSLE